MSEEYIKPSVAAKRLGIARSTIYKWISEGRIGSVEFPGGTVRIPRADFEAFEREFKRRPASGVDSAGDPEVKSPDKILTHGLAPVAVPSL